MEDVKTWHHRNENPQSEDYSLTLVYGLNSDNIALKWSFEEGVVSI